MSADTETIRANASQDAPETLTERLEAAGFSGVDVASDREYGDRRKVIVWVDTDTEDDR